MADWQGRLMLFLFAMGIALTTCLGFGPRGTAVAADESSSPAGYWKTLDDSTGRPRSIVLIWNEAGEFRGRIDRLLPEPGSDSDPVCQKCPGPKRGKKVQGLEFLWGFKRQGQVWGEGSILDPESGKEYRASLDVLDQGKKLKVTGFIKVVFEIGRSQTWERVRPGDWGL